MTDINFDDTNQELPKLFKHIGLVVTIADGIVTINGIADVGYMKLLIFLQEKILYHV